MGLLLVGGRRNAIFSVHCSSNCRFSLSTFLLALDLEHAIKLHFLFEYLFAKVKMKQCLLGISRLNRVDQVCEVVGSWKLTEIKLAKNESRHQETREGSRENREKSQRALLLADGEKCCKLTHPFLK